MKIIKTYENFKQDYWDIIDQEKIEKEQVAAKYNNAKKSAIDKYLSIITDCADNIIDEYDVEIETRSHGHNTIGTNIDAFNITFEVKDLFRYSTGADTNIRTVGSFIPNQPVCDKLIKEMNALNTKLKAEFSRVDLNVLDTDGETYFRECDVHLQDIATIYDIKHPNEANAIISIWIS